MPYFADLATNDNPDKESLIQFLEATDQFYVDLLENALVLGHPKPEGLPPLFESLREQARDVYRDYVHERFGVLIKALRDVNEQTLTEYGLTGAPQALKIKTLASLEALPGDASLYWPRVREILQQIDPILDSILDIIKDAVPGSDALISIFKEFKSTLLNIINGSIFPF